MPRLLCLVMPGLIGHPVALVFLSLAFCLRSRAILCRCFSAASPSRIRCGGYNNGEAAFQAA